MEFREWEIFFNDNNFNAFNDNVLGQLWLKIKSVTRREFLSKFIEQNKINLPNDNENLRKRFIDLYDQLSKEPKKGIALLDNFSRNETESELAALNRKELWGELLKMHSFEWGGDYRNSLDKYLVTKYVKNMNSFDELNQKLKGEVMTAVRGYVLNSWYNHWTSVLIEHIFKSHRNVVPAVGKIKGVDFFVGGVPFDLKVTYLPKEYVDAERKKMKLGSEISFLKREAKNLNIVFCGEDSDYQIKYSILEQIRLSDDKKHRSVFENFIEIRKKILTDARENPLKLITWLYENQGEMRFGSENRLFLILVDVDDFDDSWKLKRACPLLEPKINEYLNNFQIRDDSKIEFKYKGRDYKCLSDVIFIVKDNEGK